MEVTERKARGRPRSFDKDKMLQIILQEFWSKGFAATSLDDLSNATGLSRPSLYAAYGDKISMFGAALDAFVARIKDHALPPLHEADNLSAALLGFYDGVLDVYFDGKPQSPGCLVFTMAVADAPREPVIQDFLKRFLDECDQALDACIQRFVPEMPAADQRKSAQIASGMLINLALRARSGAARQELDDLAKSSVALFENPAPRSLP